MAQILFSDYIMWHETTRHPPTTGEAPPASYPASERGENSVGCSSMDFRLQEFRSTLARCIQTPWHARPASQADSWTTSSYVGCPKSPACKMASQGPTGSGIFYRPLDAQSHCGAHRETFSYRIPSQPCLAFVSEHGMELPEAGAPCLAEERAADCPLETCSLVRDKKKPQDVVPTWCFWMKAVSCLSPMSNEHGHPRAGHHISTIGFVRTEYRPLPPSAFPPSKDGQLSISDFTSVISRESTSKPSFDTYSGTCEVRSPCCGIAARSIVIDKSRPISNVIRESSQSSFLHTHRSSTLRNLSGIRPIQRFRISQHAIFQTSTCTFALPQTSYADPSNSSDRAFMPQVYHGEAFESFLYLCETQ